MRIWGDSQNICVVGDDDQSIYHWRGTRPEYLINFENRYYVHTVMVEGSPGLTVFGFVVTVNESDGGLIDYDLGIFHTWRI